MNEISVSPFEGELRADSRTFAPKMEIRHRQLMDNIKKYRVRFERMGVLPFQTEKPSEAGGRPQEYALLNEKQAIFLLTLSREVAPAFYASRFEALMAQAVSSSGSAASISCPQQQTEDCLRRDLSTHARSRQTLPSWPRT